MKFLLSDWRKLLVFLVVWLFALSFVSAAEEKEPVGSYRGEIDINQQNGVVTIGGPASPAICGNGVIEPSEQCDGSNLNGKNCSSLLGNFQGTLACQPNCIYDTSKCTAVQRNDVGNNGNGGNGGNGGGSSNIGSQSSVSNVGLSCVVEWVCSDWGACSENKQNRVCSDKNNCNATSAKPETERLCESRQIFVDDTNSLGEKISLLIGNVIGTGGKRNLTVIFIFLFLLLAILVIVNAARRDNRQKIKDKEDIEIKDKDDKTN